MSPPPLSKKPPQMEGLFSPRSPIEFVGFAVVNAMIRLFSSGNLLGFIFVPTLAIGWWLVDRQRIKRQRQSAIFPVIKEPPQAAKGLILLLSPYSPRNEALKKSIELTLLINQVIATSNPEMADFEQIGLLDSNLVPQIKAVKYHLEQGKLRDIWLITTEDSQAAAAILEKYLYYQHEQSRFDIHRNHRLIQNWEYNSLWQLGEQIFREAGYRDDVLIADITGGTKMMSVALAMACVPPKRCMQYMDSQRDWQGNPLPKGEMEPVVIDVDPILYGEGQP
jgi:CRISPR-associated protein (Cas_Cas02710)